MRIALAALGMAAYLLVVWLGEEFLRSLVSVTAFRLTERRLRHRVPSRASLKGDTQELARRAHFYGARRSIPISLVAAFTLRLLYWSLGAFHPLIVGLPIALGAAVGSVLSVWHFRRELHTRVAALQLEASPAGRAVVEDWTERIVRHARSSPELRRKIQDAVNAWDGMENLAGNASVTFDELLDPAAVRRKLADTSAVHQRVSLRATVERRFDDLLAEIATDVARLEGSRRAVARCRGSLELNFFEIAKQLHL